MCVRFDAISNVQPASYTLRIVVNDVLAGLVQIPDADTDAHTLARCGRVTRDCARGAVRRGCGTRVRYAGRAEHKPERWKDGKIT